MRPKHALAIVLILVTAACGKSNPNNPSSGSGSGSGTTLSNGSMSATIDGSSWAATIITASYTAGTILVTSGGDAASRVIAFALIPTGAGTGTYNVASNVGFNFVLNLGSAGYTSVASTANSSGTLTLTTLTNNHAVGTFTFVAVATPGTSATGSKTVTNGKFDVTY